MRRLATPLLGLAVLGIVLGGAGLAIVPHDHPSGTFPHREHALTAYRYLLLAAAEPPRPARGEPAFALAERAAEGLLAVVLTLLGVALLCLPPARRPVGPPPAAAIAPAQWAGPILLSPPRLTLLHPA